MAADVVVKVDAAHQQRYGVELVKLKACEHQATTRAYGEVLDPEPLLRQWNDWKLAAIQSQGAGQEAERARALNAQGRLASDKVLEQAENLLKTSIAQEQLARSVLEHGWGAGFTELDDAARQVLLEKLMKRELLLVRLSLPVGGVMPRKPTAAAAFPIGDESQRITGTKFWVDPKVTLSKAPGYLLLIDPGDANWPIGLALGGEIETSGATSKGLEVPSSAVVYEEGSAWIFQQGEGDDFVQKAVPIDTPCAKGWFVPTGLLDATHPIVAKGAQAILSQEIQQRVGGQVND